MDLREKQAEERKARRGNPWSGLWFVNVDMDDANCKPMDEAGRGNIRHWLNCVRYGYIVAGGGPKYSGPLKKLEIDAEIVAYQAGKVMLATAWFTAAAQPIDLFRVVGVKWKKHFDLSAAETFKRGFANQLVVCRLNDPATVRFVREVFQIADQAET